MKVLVLSHTHPTQSVGGAENAAYDLFCALRVRRDITSVTFLAGTANERVEEGDISAIASDEYLWRQRPGNYFRLSAGDLRSTTDTFRAFLQHLRPEVVFVQHFLGLGVEVLREIRRSLPSTRIVVTLHEYAAICACRGQMVKASTGALCDRETPDDCSACLPKYTPQDFWLRRHYIQRHFEFADAFVSPSEFLKSRYVEWGIPADAITVIENGLPALPTPSAPRRRDARCTIGYFGQLNEYKGVDLLLEAVALMPQSTRRHIVVEIHGANLELQSLGFRHKIEALRAPLLSDGCLRWCGSYERRELLERMGGVDWVVVPSIWWENSPLVIQEAYACHRPVIAADIGGMAEKVVDRRTGLHFKARNAVDLAAVLGEAALDRELRDTLAANIVAPPTVHAAAARYLSLATGTGG